MKKEDLKPGYVVEGVEIKSGVNIFAKVEVGINEELCISSPETWFPVDEINDDLEYKNYFRIDKVYGYSTNKNAYKISSEDRELLWERKNVNLRQTKEELGKLIDAMRRVLEEEE